MATATSIGLPFAAANAAGRIGAAIAGARSAMRRLFDRIGEHAWATRGHDAAGARSDATAGTARPSAETAAEFRRLMLPHLDAAYSLARYLTRDATAAEDIVQEAFLKALKGFDGFRGGDARGWMLAIVRNCVRDWRGREIRVRNTILDMEPVGDGEDGEMGADALDQFASEIDTPETKMLRDGEAAQVRAVVEGLPPTLREVLVLREMEDLSYRQIADVTQVPIGTVMSRLARAREAFAGVWQRLEARRGERR